MANPQPQAGSSSPVGGLPRSKPAEPTLEGPGTVAEPKPHENQQQPAPARRRRLTKRRSSAAEGMAAADKAAGEPAAVREKPHVTRATPEPRGTGGDADNRTAGCEAAGGDADNRTAGREAAGGDADDKTAGCEAAGDEAASGDADMRASPGAAEGASMGTGGAKLQQGSAKRGSASLRPAAADAEDRGQAAARVLDPQQPAKRKRLTQRADPADEAAVEASKAVGAASRPEQASTAMAQQPGSTAGAGTGAAAEEGGVAVERTSPVSKHAGWAKDKLPAWLSKRGTKGQVDGPKEAEGWWRQCCSLQATTAALGSWRGMRDAQAVAGAVCRGHTLSQLLASALASASLSKSKGPGCVVPSEASPHILASVLVSRQTQAFPALQGQAEPAALDLDEDMPQAGTLQQPESERPPDSQPAGSSAQALSDEADERLPEGSRAPALGSEAAMKHAYPAGGGMSAGRPAAAGPAAEGQQRLIIPKGGVISEGVITSSLLLDLQTEVAAAGPPQGRQASLQLDLQTEPPHVAAASGQDDQQSQQDSQLVNVQTEDPDEQPAGSSQGGSLRLDLHTEQVSGQPAAGWQSHQQGTQLLKAHMERPDAQPAGSE